MSEKHPWEYSRNQRRHYVHDGKYYTSGQNHHLWDIRSSAPYGFIQEKHGYDLYHKGKLIKHGKTVKELKLLVSLKSDKDFRKYLQ